MAQRRALRQEVAKIYRAAGDPIPEQLVVALPGLTSEQLLQVVAEAPAPLRTDKEPRTQKIIRDIARVQSQISKKIAGAGPLGEQGIEMLQGPKALEARNQDIATLKQRGIELAKELGAIPGQEALAQRFLHQFGGGTAPALPKGNQENLLDQPGMAARPRPKVQSFQEKR